MNNFFKKTQILIVPLILLVATTCTKYPFLTKNPHHSSSFYLVNGEEKILLGDLLATEEPLVEGVPVKQYIVQTKINTIVVVRMSEEVPFIHNFLTPYMTSDRWHAFDKYQIKAVPTEEDAPFSDHTLYYRIKKYSNDNSPKIVVSFGFKGKSENLKVRGLMDNSFSMSGEVQASYDEYHLSDNPTEEHTEFFITDSEYFSTFEMLTTDTKDVAVLGLDPADFKDDTTIEIE